MLLRDTAESAEKAASAGDQSALCTGTLFSSFRTKSPLIKRICHIITCKPIDGTSNGGSSEECCFPRNLGAKRSRNSRSTSADASIMEIMRGA